ncbi:hypothetical protein L207DRAFT_545978 [Hyaloscypha variabilis F]|uniref:Uncharacterized protein n=1 Tax=Hyaloscypha variabilis (strain UAMH 11265 / GT02V1 / F) TaxID=1149755 RepID=A0A2J6RD86_HYAVF|nr:hypothetical protein L207DRAFT_545978 [Hyaloscypha variabilis F]
MGPALLQQSALPPLPEGEAKKPIAIPRRPVGAHSNHAKAPSIASISSVYSDSPGLSRSLSNGSSYNTRDSLSGVDSTPPLPAKDNQRSRTMPSSPTILSSPISSLRSSPSRPEIWKRRSERSEKSLSFPELKLDRSNGSTATGRQEQPARAQIPRSLGGRKPIPARPAPPQPDLMGNKLAKLKNKSLGESSEETSNDEAPNLYTSFKRLPTPEYLKTDKAQPLTPQVVSPASPVTPPEEQAPEVPAKSEARGNIAAALLDSTNRPFFPPMHSREPSETLTITSEPAVKRSPQPKKAFAAKILTPQPSPDKASPLSLPSPISPPAGLGIHFPTLPGHAEQGAVMSGLPLNDLHFDCFQSHKFMRSSRNAICPIACMICERKDAEMRWKCVWCCLSACGSCMQVLSSIPGKDLRICLERVGRLEEELAREQ